MKQQGLLYFTDTHLTVIGLLIFFSFFIMVMIKAFKASKEEIKHLENIPFNQNEETYGK